jgi:hypothetical protein
MCEARPTREADNLTAIFEPIVSQILDISQLYRPPRPDTEIALLLFLILTVLWWYSERLWHSQSEAVPATSHSVVGTLSVTRCLSMVIIASWS